MKNRMQEICTSGSVGGEGGNIITYPATVLLPIVVQYSSPLKGQVGYNAHQQSDHASMEKPGDERPWFGLKPAVVVKDGEGDRRYHGDGGCHPKSYSC